MEMPPMPVTGERCFCPTCLRERIEEHGSVSSDRSGNGD
jgi:hypothetical protein